MSTTTETDFLDEGAPQNGTATQNGVETPIESDQEQLFDEHDHDHDGQVDPPHEHKHEFIREDGTVSPLCLGGGCPTRVPTS